MGAGRGKQEIAQVAFHMLALATNLDPFAAGADEILQRRIEVDGVAHLVEVGHLQVGATPHVPAVGRQFTQHHLEQGGLASAIGADQPDLVAPQDRAREVAHDCFVAKRFVYARQLSHDLALVAATGACINIHPHPTQRIASLGAVDAQLLQPVDAALAARAPRLDAFADPDLFLGQQLVGPCVDDSLLCQLLFLL